jgi:hypothetical protein
VSLARIRKAKFDKAFAELEEKQAALGAALVSPPGRKLLTALEAEFFEGDLLGETPEETAFCLGAREVVMALRRLARAAQRTGATDDERDAQQR